MKTLIYTLLITLMAGCTKEKPISVPAQSNPKEARNHGRITDNFDEQSGQ